MKHRKLRALAAVFVDPAAVEHEKANAERLKGSLEKQLSEKATPEGAWTGIMFRLGRGVKEITSAIIFTAIVALGLALSGSFAVLAVASAIARLVTYISVSAATIRLRHRMCGGAVQPALFVVSAGTLVPLLAIAVSLLMLAGATRQQLLGGAAALIAGAVLFIANNRFAHSHQDHS